MQILNSSAMAQADAAAMTQAAQAQNSSATTGNSSSSSSSGSSEATITANDFLTLLVTEMQNQDPTANTDPNEYINQLVQVNNLQQLISINQEVGVLDTSSGSSSTSVTGAILPSSSSVASKVDSQSGAETASTAQSVKQAAAQLATEGMNSSPMQAMTSFAASLHGEPTAASPSMEATMAASARRVASSL